MQATKYLRPRLMAIASVLFLSSYALIEISSWAGIESFFYYDQQQRRLSSDVPTNNAVPGMAAEELEPMSPGRLRRDKFLKWRVKNAAEAWQKLTETETEEDIWLRPNKDEYAALKGEVSYSANSFACSCNCPDADVKLWPIY